MASDPVMVNQIQAIDCKPLIDHDSTQVMPPAEPKGFLGFQ